MALHTLILAHCLEFSSQTLNVDEQKQHVSLVSHTKHLEVCFFNVHCNHLQSLKWIVDRAQQCIWKPYEVGHENVANSECWQVFGLWGQNQIIQKRYMQMCRKVYTQGTKSMGQCAIHFYWVRLWMKRLDTLSNWGIFFCFFHSFLQ